MRLLLAAALLLWASVSHATPSVVVVLADDMRHDDTQYVPSLAAIAKRGVNFTGALAPFPLCTPSRVSLLTGKRVESHGVVTNDIALADLSDTIATRVKQQGWRTGYVGKFGNKMRALAEQPPGWDSYSVLMKHSDYGSEQAHVLARMGEEFLAGCHDTSCLLIVAPALPHGGPRGPKECGVSTVESPVDEHAARWRYRMKALCGLDYLLRRVEAALPTDATLVVTSDHGYIIADGKLGKNEQVLDAHRIPLVVARRGLAPATRGEIVTPVDLATSIVAWAGGSTAGYEGRSIEPLLEGSNERWINPVTLWSVP